MSNQMPELAFYYPNPIWARADWIKNLILFFDGIALLVPDYMRDRPFEVDPAIATGLQEHGLLKILEPETFMDRTAAEALATAMSDIIVSGSLDNLAKRRTKFHELSYSRLGYMADAGLAEMVYEELEKRGLARPTEDGVSIPMHPMVRSLVLVLLAQILRPTGRRHGLELSPATDQPEIQKSLVELLRLPSIPSAGHVVSLDIEAVGVDLSAVPFDEVLSFRTEHRDKYRIYARTLRQFLREIGDLSPDEQQRELKNRQAEVKEGAAQLRKAARGAWKRPASFGLGLAGAVWTLTTGDIVGGLLALGAGLAGAELSGTTETSAYSYLFTARRRFS
jgi:hypothetical protein